MKTRAVLLLALFLCALLLPAFARVNAVYEVFTGSFADWDGDGTGDLRGIEERLEYIQALGVDGLWLTPVCPSPSYHKYDCASYTDIDPAFGTLSDYEALSAACKARGITLLFDLAVNHTSTEHPWFVAAVQSLQAGNLSDPYIGYYQFLQGGDGHPVEGTDWFYAGGFGPHMPELNLDNPAVREEILAVAAFWLSHGAGGFRLDAVTHYYDSQPEENRAFLAWFSSAVKEINPNALIVGEAWTDELLILDLYQSGADVLFNFPLSSTGSLTKAMQNQAGQAFAARILGWQQRISAINPLAFAAPFLGNHDQGRIAGVLRNDVQQMKQAAALYLLSPGVPFLYYGEELGMTGSGDDPNKRLPMLWSTENLAGVCAPPPGATQAQRLQTGADAQEADPLSLLHFYRGVLTFRSLYPAFTRGSSVVVETTDTRLAAFALADGEVTVLVAHNFAHDETLFIPCGGTLLQVFDTGATQSVPAEGGIMLAPRSSAVWLMP